MLSAKDIKGLTESGTALGLKDKELRDYIKNEKLRLEKQKQEQIEREEKDNEREMEKLKLEMEERQKDKDRETERMKLGQLGGRGEGVNFS